MLRALLLIIIIFSTSCSFLVSPKKHNSKNKENKEIEKSDDKGAGEVICKNRCENGFMNVYSGGTGADKCSVSYSYPCFPAGCDRSNTNCRVDCSSNRDCSLGAECNTLERKCVPAGVYTCKDSFTKVGATGLQGSCIPYRCNLGQCMSSCVSGSDCAKGFICDKNQCIIQ